jgi:SAM-dependent methyltransferase
VTELSTHIESIARGEWTDDYVRRYQHATYGQPHQRGYLQYRSETLASLLDRCRQNGGPLRVLEVACGPGLSLDYLSRRRPDDRLTGIDMSREMLRLASRNAGRDARRPRLAQASARDLPFADESFDVVYATRFLHIFRDRRPFVEELTRVTRRGGTLILEFYPRPYHLLRYFAQRSNATLNDHLYHYPTMAEVRGLMGPGAEYLPLRFGAERVVRRALGDALTQRLLRAAWNTPLRIAIAEYFAVIRRS